MDRVEPIVAALRTRLDRDERAAQRSRTTALIADLTRCRPGTPGGDTLEHHRRWEPTRVLPKVAAEREIVDLCAAAARTGDWPARDLARQILEVLARDREPARARPAAVAA